MPEVRLIDANALKNSFDSAYTTFGQCVYAKGIVDRQPTIPNIDRDTILRLCNEIEMIIVTVCDTGYTLQVGDEEAIMKRTKAIRKELAEDAGTD